AELCLAQPRQRLGLERCLARLECLVADARHVDCNRGPVAEPPGRTRSEIPALQARLELERAQEELASRGEGFARDWPAPRGRERVGGLGGELLRRRAVELVEECGRLVEVVGTDLEQIVAGALAQ